MAPFIVILRVNSKWQNFFWDHSYAIFFLPPPCQSAGLHYFLKIKVRKNSADTFLTFPPYKQLYHLQYQQNWVPSLRNRKWLLLMTDFFFYVDDWHISSAISSYGLTLKSERSWSFICLSQVSKLGRRIRTGKTWRVGQVQQKVTGEEEECSPKQTVMGTLLAVVPKDSRED